MGPNLTLPFDLADRRGWESIPFTRSSFGRDMANPLSLLLFWVISDATPDSMMQ